jgi:hypothetical protein
MKPRIVCWFSHGATSLEAAKITVEKYGTAYDVRVVCCDTRPSEHEDNYKLSQLAEDYIGQAIEFIGSLKYKTVDEVIDGTQYMAGPQGARCTVELKKKPRFAYQLPDDIHVFGFGAEESGRIKQFENRNPELTLWWVLAQRGLTKRDCLKRQAEAGIPIMGMYRLGFDNNNCPGCVKVTSPWYWDMIRHHFPLVFQKRCEQSRRLNVRLLEMNGKRLFLDELPHGPFKKHRREKKISCGPECGYAT